MMTERQTRRLVTLCREIDELTADISKKRSMIQNRTRQIRLIVNKEQRNGKRRQNTQGSV